MTTLSKIKNEISNPVSRQASSFSYPVIWISYLCARWLSDPEMFQWIQLKNKSGSPGFQLNYLLVRDPQERHHLYYIYECPNENLAWNFNDFLKRSDDLPTEMHISLFEALLHSYSCITEKIKIDSAVFITNGHASGDITETLEMEKLSLSKMKSVSKDVFEKLEVLFPDTSRLSGFFSDLRFLFGRNFGVRKLKVMERHIRQYCFYNKLKIPPQGVTNLLKEIQNRCATEGTETLFIRDIHYWCGLKNPDARKDE